MHDNSQNNAENGLRRRTEERLGALEKIAVALPVLVTETLLILSLFLPFVTATSYDRDDEFVTLSQLGLAFFGVNSSAAGLTSGDVDNVGVIFGVAFLGLFIVLLGCIVGLLFVARGQVSKRAASVITTCSTLLVVGTVGAWLVIAIGSTSDSPWLPEAASFTLVLGALLGAVVTCFPAFRSIWLRR